MGEGREVRAWRRFVGSVDVMQLVGDVLADLGEVVIAGQDLRHRFFYYYMA